MHRLACLIALLSLISGPVRAQIADLPICAEPENDDRCETWIARYDGRAKANDHARATAVSPDGRTVYVTGDSSTEAGDWDVTTVAYSAATGAKLWDVTEAAAGYDTGRDVGVTPDGTTVIVAARVAGSPPDYGLFAYDATTGARRWQASYDAGDDSLEDMAVSDDGTNVFVTGWSATTILPSGVPGYDFVTAAFDVRSGRLVWTSTYDGPAGFWDIPQALDAGTIHDDGSARSVVVVTGRSNGESSDNNATDFATVAYDGKTGAELWVARYDGPDRSREYAYALDISDDGSTVVVAGESWSNAGGFDYATVTYDLASGTERWAARGGTPGEDRPLKVLSSPDGRSVFVTGHTDCCVARQMTTIAYDSGGDQRWTMSRSGPAGEVGHELALTPDGRSLIVAGMRGGHVVGVGVQGVSPNLGYARFLTVRYDAASGRQAWAAQLEAGAFTGGMAMASDGTRVFVTGGGQSSLSGDYMTVAYET